jgi:hypothetical protein
MPPWMGVQGMPQQMMNPAMGGFGGSMMPRAGALSLY